jgi:ABC-2 type transport system ATP-binding protein
VLAERLQLDLSRRAMSTGMRQKLALVVALAPDVPLVILDEPTTNLDPTVRREVVEVIRESRSSGRTVLFSSHVLSEVEDACDRVIVLRAGRLVETVRVAEVRRQHGFRRSAGSWPPPELAATRDRAGLNGDVTILAAGDYAVWVARGSRWRLQIEPVAHRLRAAPRRSRHESHR